MKGIIIQGSARSDGNTDKIVQMLNNYLDFDVVDLKQKKISHFDYDFNNQYDDFLPIIRKIADDYDFIVFATPVYWFTMSGIMKAFFDRLSDCLRLEKETGRKLRGKNMAVICCGSGEKETEGFFLPFIKSADYLGIKYLADVHCWIEEDLISDQVKKLIQDFAGRIV